MPGEGQFPEGQLWVWPVLCKALPEVGSVATEGASLERTLDTASS